ncbi:hypothetical protein E2562_039188 [Oryza meyeriana var. granulata]|uniref:Uncharacterized protein n=1 Tax=Oryza meyeriana var. granulata TaxID=110450 RepID=A0A6G1E8X1_9ORYZ|nr:hypothetical protein E2562_039188 [Oryza meyeriana var. granulata]
MQTRPWWWRGPPSPARRGHGTSTTAAVVVEGPSPVGAPRPQDQCDGCTRRRADEAVVVEGPSRAARRRGRGCSRWRRLSWWPCLATAMGFSTGRKTKTRL